MKYFPNILLIAGTGRNVGKTMLACKIIRYLSESMSVVAIKISSHLHKVENGQKMIVDMPNYQILEESLDTDKDSSRMKKAGAKKVIYIQTKQENLYEAFQAIEAEIKDYPIVCESGGLNQCIKPGIFFLVTGNEIPDNKKYLLKDDPVLIKFYDGIPNVEIENIHYQNNKYQLI